MGDITALGDRCHWRLKAPASGSERIEVESGEKTERETVAAERVNTNAAGGEVPREGRRQGGTGGGAFFRLRGRHMVLPFFGLHNVTARALKNSDSAQAC